MKFSAFSHSGDQLLKLKKNLISSYVLKRIRNNNNIKGDSFHVH